MQVYSAPSQPQQAVNSMLISVQSPAVAYTQPPPPVYQPPPTTYDFKQTSETSHQPSYNAAPPQYGSWQQQQQQIAGPSFQAMPQVQSAQTVQVTVANAPMAIVQPVIIAQPIPALVSPPSYLGWSIFNFLCCFWPLGLAAIIYSVKVGSARSAGEARSYSLIARNLNIAATALAPILLIVVVAAVVGGAATKGLRSSSYDYYDSYATYYSYLSTYSYIVYDFYSSSYGVYYYSYTVYAYQYLSALG